jgi:nucleotide-binding universal stress UspA family protein
VTGRAPKTIAVHLPAAALCQRLLDAAAPLAEAHGATIIGVHVLPPVVVYADATVAMSTEFIVAQQEAFQEEARGIEKAFRERMARSPAVAHEWVGIDTGEEPTMRAAATACNSADLVVASQYHESIPAAAGYSPDELVLGTGRPVLIVPIAGEVRPVGSRVIVAWNGSREAARACFDALGLLRPAASLALVAVDSPRGEASIEPMRRTLMRHGLEPAAVRRTRKDGRTVVEEILNYARESSADMIVLGCYGHSRLRETVFGGATTRMLRDMTLPLLMAH